MIQRLSSLRFLSLGFGLYILGNLLILPAAGADAPWPTTKWLGIACIAALTGLSTLAWGRLSLRLLGLLEEPVLYLPLGSAFLSIVGFGLGALGGLGPHKSILWTILLLLPFAQNIPLSFPRIHPAAALAFLILLALAFIPQAHPDPLYYHLLSLQRWYAAGGLKFFPELPLLFQTGIWECLYLWPLQVIAPAPGQDLIAQQLIAQIIHLSVGYLGCYFLIEKILSKEQVSRAGLWALVILAQVFFLESAFTAKNDWGILLWACAALYLLRYNQRPWAGVLIGLAISTKWSVAVGFLPLLVLAKPNFKLGFFILLGALPIIARNLYFTGLPFFPLGAIRSNLISATDKLLFETYQGYWQHLTFTSLWRMLWALLSSHPVYAFLFLAPLSLVRRMLSADLRRFGVGISIAIAIALLTLHPALSWRLSGPLPLFLALFCALLWQQTFANKIRVKSADLILVGGLAVLAWLPFALNFLPNLTFSQPAEVIRSFRAGEAMAWLRLSETKDKVAVGGNPELYYLGNLDASYLEASPLLDTEFVSVHSPAAFIQKLYALNYRWYLETGGGVPRGIYANYLNAFLFHDEPSHAAIAYEGPLGRVWDLSKLKKRLEEADFKDPPYKAPRLILDQQK